MAKSEEKDEKIELLKKECRIAKVPFTQVHRIYPSFWNVLYDIIMQKPHEQKEIENGVIFTKEYIETDFSNELKKELKDYYLDDSANGKNTFSLILKDGKKTSTLIFGIDLSQNDLLAYTKDENKNNLIITRLNNEIRIYYHGTICVCENRIWNIYKKKTEILQIIKQSQVLIPKNFEILLEYAYYDLALNKIGTTLVFFTDDKNITDFEAKDPQQVVNLSDSYERALLKNYVKNHDGAIIINSNNQVIKINAKLQYSNKAANNAKANNFTGMRHTSSVAYSYDHKNTLIITVSDDGGATVFNKGKKILSMTSEVFDSSLTSRKTQPQNGIQLNYISSNSLQPLIKRLEAISNSNKIELRTNIEERLTKLQQMAEERGEIGETGASTVTCPGCGHKYMVGYVKITGWNDHEELDCKYCGKTYYSKSCFELIGEPIN